MTKRKAKVTSSGDHQAFCNICGSKWPSWKAAKSHRSKAHEVELRRRSKKARTDRGGYCNWSSDEDVTMNPPSPPEPPLELPEGSKRQSKMPARFVDFVPSSTRSSALPSRFLPHLFDHIPPDENPAPCVEPAQPVIVQRDAFVTETDEYGMFSAFPNKPIQVAGVQDVYEDPSFDDTTADDGIEPSSVPPSFNKYHPFPNFTAFAFTKWVNNEGGNKSHAEIDKLVQDVILHPEFDREHLRNYKSGYESHRLNNALSHSLSGWQTTTVEISLPPEDGKHRARDKVTRMGVKGVQYRSLIETIKSVLKNTDGPSLQHEPYRQYWKPTADAPTERVFGELYTADAWLEAYKEVRELPKRDDIDNFVLPVQLYSDSTHLANFGDASLWPLYGWFGGWSKYDRNKSSLSTCQHLAYICSVRTFSSILYIPAVTDFHVSATTRGSGRFKEQIQPRWLTKRLNIS
jgi:hypothetical protein